MKRSEMLEKIAKEIRLAQDSGELIYTLAENVLDLVEEAGMLPPKWNNYNPSQYDRTFSRDSDWGSGTDTPDGSLKWYLDCNDWEQE